jgi:hypothetical protein
MSANSTSGKPRHRRAHRRSRRRRSASSAADRSKSRSWASGRALGHARGTGPEWAAVMAMVVSCQRNSGGAPGGTGAGSAGARRAGGTGLSGPGAGGSAVVAGGGGGTAGASRRGGTGGRFQGWLSAGATTVVGSVVPAESSPNRSAGPPAKASRFLATARDRLYLRPLVHVVSLLVSRRARGLAPQPWHRSRPDQQGADDQRRSDREERANSKDRRSSVEPRPGRPRHGTVWLLRRPR